MTVLYVHRTDIGNPGDMWSCPVHYMPLVNRGPVVDIFGLPGTVNQPIDTMIVGGGGLFYSDRFLSPILQLVETNPPKNLIVWGVGSSGETADPLLQKADLWGTRELRGNNEDDVRWLPCSSVLHPAIRERIKRSPTKNFLVVDHWKCKNIRIPLPQVTRTNNNPAMIENILDLISDHDYVITGSYHVWYWSVLLRRRVVVIADPVAASTKFANLPYDTPVASEFSWKLLDQTKTYPDAYAECSERNQNFMNQVIRLITSP